MQQLSNISKEFNITLLMEALLDPINDRAVRSVEMPIARPLTGSKVFLSNNLPNWKVLKDFLTREARLLKSDLMAIFSTASDIFRREPNLIEIQDPITVVGDIHGQFYDLLKILEIGGSPETSKYLFLGDYVDRGMFSMEVLVLLYSLKINYPSTIVMLRGNHESRQMTTMFNFRQECVYKYDLEVYEAVMRSFDMMPIACVLNSSFLAVHGGISPELRTISDINAIDRFMEVPRNGLLCDLLWSDPVASADGRTAEVYKSNDSRGCSYFFGADATKKLLKDTDLISVIRAHEVQKDGYKMQFWYGNEFPSVITIFSAPNYCDSYKNKGAVIKFKDGALNIQQYVSSKHPYLLPDFMDVFTWSIPFVIEKVMKMLQGVIKPAGKYKDNVDEKAIAHLKELEESIAQNSMMTGEIERVIDSIKGLREKHEKIISCQVGFSDGANRGVSVLSGNALADDNEIFYKAMDLDKVNEKRF